MGGKGRSGQGTGHADAPREGRQVKAQHAYLLECNSLWPLVVEVKLISGRSQVLSIITAISQVRAGCGVRGLLLDGHYPW